MAISASAQSYAASSPASLSMASGMNRFALASTNAHPALRGPANRLAPDNRWCRAHTQIADSVP